MEWTTPPVVPAHATPAPEPSSPPEPAEPTRGNIRRAVLTAGLSALLLVGGGVAVVSAASPDPSSAPSTAPSDGTTTAPKTHSGSSADCPNMGGDGTTGAPQQTPAT